MISAVFLVPLLAVAAAIPDCSQTPFVNGIGFVAGDSCQSYYMCTKNPLFAEGNSHDENYSYTLFCCAEGLGWDVEHLTCIRDSYCTDARTLCPNTTFTTTNTPCPNRIDENDPSKYFTAGYEHMSCPVGLLWDQEICTCVSDGVLSAPCQKLLWYTFDANFDSESCNNFAVGSPFGGAALADGALSLNVSGAFLAIPYLNNWFAWNPQARTFTLCFSVTSSLDEPQNAGLFGSNCEVEQSPLLDITVQADQIVANMGGQDVPTGEVLNGSTKVCVVFNNGVYTIYVNGVDSGSVPTGSNQAINTQAAPTVGVVDGFPSFIGSFDDVCFWSSALDASELA